VTAAEERPRVSLSRQAGALASGSMATQAAQLLLLMALTRLVPKSQLGGYQQLTLIYGIVSPLLLAGIPAALLYFVPRSGDPAGVRRWVGAAYVLLAAIGAGAAAVVVVARQPIAEALGNPALADPLVVYAPYLFFAFVGAVMPSAMVAVGRAGRAAALNALGGAIVLVAVAGAAVVEPSTTSLAGALSIAAALTATVSTVAVARMVGLSLARDSLRQGTSAILAYGVPLALTGLAGTLAFQFDRLVVSREFSPALYAVYVVGAVELPIAVIVQQSVNAVLVPALARHWAEGDRGGMAALWRRAIRRTSLVLLPVFVFFEVTATDTIQALFGQSYDRSADVFRVYLALVPIRCATYGLITQAIGRPGINLSASFVVLVVNAVLVLALVGPLGLVGPAVGTVLATAVMSAYYLVRLRGILRMRIRQLFPIGLLAVNLSLSALAAVPLALVILVVEGAVARLVVGAVVYALSYVAVLAFAGRLEPRELALLRAPLQYAAGRYRRTGARLRDFTGEG
jgi:O-antigen/teichoic acid export membrane protein